MLGSVHAMSGQPRPTYPGQLASPCSISVGELRVQAALFSVCGLPGVSLGSNLIHAVSGSTFAQCEQVFNPVLNVEGTTVFDLSFCGVYLSHVESVPSNHSVLCRARRAPLPLLVQALWFLTWLATVSTISGLCMVARLCISSYVGRPVESGAIEASTWTAGLADGGRLGLGGTGGRPSG